MSKQRTRRAGGRRIATAAIEALEPRQLFSLFLNDVDSNNLGKGMWAWTLSSSMTNDGFTATDFTGWFNYHPPDGLLEDAIADAHEDGDS